MSQLTELDFTESKVKFRKELISIAMPVALQNLMLALVGASDALMLGRLSQDAVSAVSLANQVSFIMNLFIASVIGGCGTLITQYYGKGDHKTVKNLMSMGIRLCTVISIIFFIVTFFLPENLMRIYTSDQELIQIGSQYLRIVSWSFLFSGIAQNYLLVMKISGRASKSAIISGMTVFIDMFVDFFLIYGIAGMPRLGVAGCAISTVVVEAGALVICVVDSYKQDHIHPDKSSILKYSKNLYKDLAHISFPMLASCLSWGIGFSMHSMIMGHLGKDAIAAAAVISVIQELATCFCKGLSSGASIMTGQLLGQNRMEEAKSCGAKFCKIAILCGIVNVALLLIVGPIVSMFFILTDAAQSYLIKMMFVLAVYLFAYALNTIITCGIFPAGGDSLYDAKTVVISMWCFSLPLGLLGTFVFNWPVMLIYIFVMADEIVKLPWLYPRYKKYIWVKNLTREDAAQ